MTSVLYIQEQYIITPRKSNILLFLKGARVTPLKLKQRSDCTNPDVDLQLARSSYLRRSCVRARSRQAATYRCLSARVRGCPLYSDSDLSGFLWQGCVLWLPTQRAGVPRKRPSTAWPLTVPTRPVADTPWMSPRKGTLSESKKKRSYVAMATLFIRFSGQLSNAQIQYGRLRTGARALLSVRFKLFYIK